MMLLAHHFEVAFTPIYIGQLALGVWVGWRVAGACVARFRT
jgi:hypothetical protein